MATSVVPYVTAAGRAKVDLTSWAGTLSFSATPVAGDQLEYNSALTVNLDGTYSGPAGSYTFRLLKADGNIYTAAATIQAGDTTPPTLSNATGAASSSTQIQASVTTDEANGTMYAYVSQNATETATTIKASGGSSAVSTTSVSFIFNSLTAGQSYYVHFVQDDAATNESNVIRTSSIAMPTADSATATVTFGPGTGKAYVELVAGFDPYIFEQWPAGEPAVGWQLAFPTADYSLDIQANLTTNNEGVFDLWAIDLGGVTYYQTIDTTALNSTAGDTITSVTVPAAGTYTDDGVDVLQFTVNYTLNITVTGTPRLVLNIGGVTKYADYVSGSGTNALVFEYTVESGLTDLDGIQLTSFELNGGSLVDSNSDLASTSLVNVGSLTGVLIDTADPVGTVNSNVVNVAQPEITGTIDDATATVVVSPGSVSATNNGDGTWTLAAGQITALTPGLNTITATFTDPAGNVTTASNIVEYQTTSLVVVANDLSTSDPTPVVTGTVNLIGSAVTVTVLGTTYNAVVSGLDWSAEITSPVPLGVTSYTANGTATNGTTASDTGNITLVDTDAPSVINITPPAADIYIANDVLTVLVQFDEIVQVTGTPLMPVAIGANSRNLSYVSGHNTDTLTFQYTVQAGDDDDELTFASISLNGGSIQDEAGNNASLSFVAVTTSGVVVDTTPATITLDPQTTTNSAPIITGTSSETSATLTLQVAGVTYNPVVSADGTWQQQIGSLPLGPYTMTLDAVDAAGQASTQQQELLTIELPEEISDPTEPDRLTNAINLLKRRLGRFTDNPVSLDDYILPELVAAQNRLENKATLPWFLKTRIDTIVTTPNIEKIVKPYNWIRIRDDWEIPVQLKYQGVWRQLTVYSYEEFWKNTSETPSVPRACAQDGQEIVLGPTPDGSYPVKLGFYKREFTLVPNKVTSNAWLKYAFDLIVAEAGFILANNYLKNDGAAAQFAAEIQRAERDLRMTTIAYETAAMESWELKNGR